MDLHIILIILIVLILVILVAHGLWSSRREKSQMFKSASTFTYDSRTEGQDLLDHELSNPTADTVGSHIEPVAQATNNVYPPQTGEVSPPTQPVSAQVSVEQAVNNIRITLPQQPDNVSPVVTQTSAATLTGGTAEALSRSALLDRTIADLEQEMDSDEGINTSSSILREELARVTQQNKITVSEPVVDNNIAATPTAAAETIRAQLTPKPKPQPESEPNDVAEPQAEKPKTIVLYVVSPNNQGFLGTQVVQSLESLGFLFGQHSLYHRHLDLDGNSPILFSAANMMNPGIFDLDTIADFRTVGLVLFMHLPSPGSDLANFRLLLRAAQTLAEQLGGQVLNDKRQPFDEQTKNYYLNLIS